MSELSLDRLFQRIIESEQTEENRREQITLLKTQINDAKTELKSINDSCSSSKGRLHILVRQYHNESAECSVLNIQKESLQLQKADMMQDIENMKSECARNKEIMFSKQSEYSKTVRQFCADFDLTGEGAIKRREATLNELNRINEEVEVGKEKYAKLVKEAEKVTEAKEQRVCLQADISQLQAQIIDADAQLERKKLEVKEAATKVDQVRVDCEKDPELLQLQRRFDSVIKQNQDLESKLRKLKAELARMKRNRCITDDRTLSGPPTKAYKFHSFAGK